MPSVTPLCEDPRLPEARQRPIGWYLDRLEVPKLRRAGREMVGPCPMPGCGGRDRFAVNLDKGVFLCRVCGIRGDGIALVRALRGLGLREALDWICGPAPALTEDERAALRDRAERAERARDADAERYSRRAIAEARRIWQAGVPAEGTAVRDYLALRGLGADRLPVMPSCLRYHPSLAYMHDSGSGWAELHRGPAMLAAIQDPQGRFCGVHRTWIDLARPKGKAKIPDPAGDPRGLPAKKVHGRHKGGAIRLSGPSATAPLMVVAEGIETTLTSMVASLGRDAVFWSAVSLGNISGRMAQGKGLRYSGLPDMDDARAFLPPDWVQELVIVRDGDSEPHMTAARCLAGARRAMRAIPGLRARVAAAPGGMDLNDLIMGPSGGPSGPEVTP